MRASGSQQTPAGIIPALVTPLDRQGELNESGLREVVDFTIAGGVHGVFVLGSSGEIYGLSDREKQRVVEITVEHTAGRVPVYCGASEITTRDCIRTARMVQSVSGVAALSVLTPYFLTPTQEELIGHYTQIAGSVELPTMLYGNDGKTHVSIEVETCRRLSHVDGIIGIKDSSGDMTRTLEYLRVTDPGFTVLAGRDTLIYAALGHGARGAIATTANVAPRLVSGIYEAFRNGDRERALQLQLALAPLRTLVDTATFPVVLKEGLRLQGVDAGYAFAPAGDLDEAQRERLRAVIDDLDRAI